MVSENILKDLGERPIAYYPILKDVTESLHGTIMLSQLLYWFRTKSKIYKTDPDMMKELNMSAREFRTAKASIKKLPFIKVTKAGIPARTFYTLHRGDFEEAIKNIVIEREHQREKDEKILRELEAKHVEEVFGKDDGVLTESTEDTVENDTTINVETVPTANVETVQTVEDETVITVEDDTVVTNTESTQKTTPEITTEIIVSSDEGKPHKKETNYSVPFDLLWSKYTPSIRSKKGAKPNAYKAYLKARDLFSDEDLLRILTEYMDSYMYKLNPAHLSTLLNGILTNTKYREEFVEGGFEKRLEKVKVEQAIKQQSTQTAQERYLKDLSLHGPLNPSELIRRTSELELELNLRYGIPLASITKGERHEWVKYTGPGYVGVKIKSPVSKLNKVTAIFTIDELRNNLYVHLHGREWSDKLEAMYTESNASVQNTKDIDFKYEAKRIGHDS